MLRVVLFSVIMVVHSEGKVENFHLYFLTNALDLVRVNWQFMLINFARNFGHKKIMFCCGYFSRFLILLLFSYSLRVLVML